MKSRIAMTAMLVTGLLMSGTGAGLAVSGLNDNASSAQYLVPPTTTPPTTTTPPPPTTTLPPAPQGGTLPTTSTETPQDGDVASGTDSTPPSGDASPPRSGDEPTVRESAAQPARQVEAASDELPFTGFAAVPILVGGIALFGGGLVLRRRTA